MFRTRVGSVTPLALLLALAGLTSCRGSSGGADLSDGDHDPAGTREANNTLSAEERAEGCFRNIKIRELR